MKLIFSQCMLTRPTLNEAFRTGASGYLLKRSAAMELLQAVQSVMDGNFYITPIISKEIVAGVVKFGPSRLATIDNLTTRQREILQLVAEGFSAESHCQPIEDFSPNHRIP